MRWMQDHPVYLTASIGRREMNFLVNTVSHKCVISRRLVERVRMQPAGCTLFAANGTVINVMGEITLDVCVGYLLIKFVASDNVTKSMLGSNWLRQYQMIWDFSKDVLLVRGRVFQFIPEEKNKARKRARALLERVKAASLEDECVRKCMKEDMEAQRGIERLRYEESKPICVMNRILTVSLTDDHSGRTVDIVNAEETIRGEDRVQCPRRNAPMPVGPVRYINWIHLMLSTDKTLISQPHAYADTLGAGGKKPLRILVKVVVYVQLCMEYCVI